MSRENELLQLFAQGILGIINAYDIVTAVDVCENVDRNKDGTLEYPLAELTFGQTIVLLRTATGALALVLKRDDVELGRLENPEDVPDSIRQGLELAARQVPCPDCHGSGKSNTAGDPAYNTDGHMLPCGNCSGMGYIDPEPTTTEEE